MTTATSLSIENILNFLKNGRCFFILTTLFVTICIKKDFSFLVNFHLPVSPLLVHKIIFTIPTNILPLYILTIFYLSLFAYKHPNNLHEKYFPYLNHFGNSGCLKGPGSEAVLWGLAMFQYPPCSLKYGQW